jgi:hypothetical protein
MTTSYPTEHYVEIINAPDYVYTVLGTQPITEPLGAAKGMTRVTSAEGSSVSVGYQYNETVNYRDSPSSTGWAAEVGRSYTEEAL